MSKKNGTTPKSSTASNTHADGTGRQPGGAMRAQFTDPQNYPPNGYDTSRMSYMGTHTLSSWLEMLTGPGQGKGIAPSVRQAALDGRAVKVPFRVGTKRLLAVLKPVHGSGGLMLEAWAQGGGYTGVLTNKLRKWSRV